MKNKNLTKFFFSWLLYLHLGHSVLFFDQYPKVLYLKNCLASFYKFASFSIFCFVNCILYSVFCILYCVFCILYSVFCIVYSVSCILYSVFCIMYSVSCILYSVFCILFRSILKTLLRFQDDILVLGINHIVQVVLDRKL